ncbi:MAG: MFS transporter, partial [Synechococcales cyanobacterium]
MPPLLKIIQTPKMAALLLLGFSSGLPLFLTSSTLQAWMKDAKVDLGTIGWFSLVGLPYTLKFFWSPLLDRFVPPVLGRRRGWLLITQLLLLVSIAPFGWHNPTQALQLIALNAILISFLSATQDIAGDAYRTDILSPHELGFGASTWVLGYRIAILISSSLALVLADYLPWSVVYGLMALLMGVGIVTTLWAPEPASAVQPPDSVIEAVKLPFINFFTKFGLTPAFVLL